MGNDCANLYWEKRLPANFQRPKDSHSLGVFIRDKYVNKRYCAQGMDAPSIENYQQHVLAKESSGPSVAVSQVSEQANELQESTVTPMLVDLLPDVSNHASAVSDLHKVVPVQSNNAPAGTFDLLSLDEPEASPVSPNSIPGEWASFQAAPSLGHQHARSVEWTSFEAAPQISYAPEDLVVPVDPFLATNEPVPIMEAPSQPTQIAASSMNTTEDILKLYDSPAGKGGMVLPPNLGLPLGLGYMGGPGGYGGAVRSHQGGGIPMGGAGHHQQAVQYPPVQVLGSQLYPQVAQPLASGIQNFVPMAGKVPMNGMVPRTQYNQASSPGDVGQLLGGPRLSGTRSSRI